MGGGRTRPELVHTLDQDFQQRVSLALSRATTSEPPTAGTTGWPTLSVEDPQGLAQLDADQAERLRQAKRSLREGDLRTADLQLAGLDAPAARFYKAYRACAAGDFAAAAKLLQRLLADDPGFVAARALLAYAFARAGRSDLATAEAAESIPQRMDLPWGHLADARARWQTLPLDQPLDPAGVLRTFEVPSALGAGDPLVSEETAVLRELLNVELALDQRVAEGAFTVCFASPTPLAEARDLAKFLESLEQAFEQTLSGDAARAQRVWLLHPDAALELLPAGVRSAYLPRFGALVFRGSPTTTPDVARAAADAYLARAVPLAPAWLRLGLRAELVLGPQASAPTPRTS